MTSINAAFEWKCQPKAEALVLDILEKSCQANRSIENLKQELLHQTSTRLFDWLDHVVVGHSEKLEKELEDAGFISEIVSATYRAFRHPGAQLPRVVMQDNAPPVLGIAVSVDSIADFLMVRGIPGWIEGSPFSEYRRCAVNTEHDVTLWVVERRGSNALEPTNRDSHFLAKYMSATEMWQTRPRSMPDANEAMDLSLSIAEQMVALVGRGMAAWIVLEGERKYWQSRNRAAQLQKNRQDRLGMGWANHDHHTFRSSRHLFPKLVRLFEMLGFTCRERFYAGQEAGWGAQVMEHADCRLILFLDVDLLPNEIEIDFRHQQMPELNKLATVGLWCALHGDSILKSGMHHMEAQFMFDDLKEELSKIGVNMMQPFSDFTYLKQAFTSGEKWPVEPKKINGLLAKRLITEEQAERFQKEGAIGSHLENLQRREGYKGFNQRNVSIIIQKTDPRNINF